MSKVDRMLHNMEMRGLLSNVQGIIVGQFNKYKHPENGFDDMYSMLHEYLRHYNIPVCYDFPVGPPTFATSPSLLVPRPHYPSPLMVSPYIINKVF